MVHALLLLLLLSPATLRCTARANAFQSSQQTAGALDTTFGTGGIVTTGFGEISVAQAIAQQSDGKLVVAGFTITPKTEVATVVVRYNLDGSLDTSFGISGSVTMTNLIAFTMALQPNDQILLAGANTLVEDSGEFALARLNTDGSVDTSFGGGLVTSGFGGASQSIGFAVAVQPDGKIIEAGGAGTTENFGLNFAAARFNSDGSLDTTFGDSGHVVVNVAGSIASSIVLQQDGGIVLGGTSGIQSAPKGSLTLISLAGSQAVIVRLTATGAPDDTFGAGGLVQTSLGIGNGVLQLALQSDGKILAAGTTLTSSGLFDFALARYNTDGSVDSGFGGNGVVTTNLDGKSDVATGVAVQLDGKIVLGGESFPQTAAASGVAPASAVAPSSISFFFVGVLTAAGAQFAVARYNADGSLDTSFGNSGSTITPIQQSAAGSCLIIQQDNNIVLAGGASQGGDDIDFAVARYQAGPLDGEFSLSANQSSQTVDAGSSANFTISAQPVSGSSPPVSQVALSASISPTATGLSASFADASVAVGGSVSLEVSTSSSTPAGPYAVTITGTAGSITVTTNVMVTVTTAPDFSLGFSSPSVTVSPGTKAPITVLVNRTGGFTGKVKVAAPTSLPAGVTIKGAPSVSTKGTSVTFKLKISASAAAGSNQLVFTGTDKTGRTRTGTVTLVIQ